MANGDVIEDLVNLVHPWADRASVMVPGTDGQSSADGANGADLDEQDREDAVAAANDAIGQRRRELEQNLRAAQDALPDVVQDHDDEPSGPSEPFDPVINEIMRARDERHAAEQRLRMLLAYAREFPTRPYPLTQLATAAGMSFSGVRTAYSHAEIFEVAARIQRRAYDIYGLRGDAGPAECAVIAANRNQRAISCRGVPTTTGVAPDLNDPDHAGRDREFFVCTHHSYLVRDPRPIHDPTATSTVTGVEDSTENSTEGGVRQQDGHRAGELR